MQMTPGATAALQPVTGKALHKAGGERGKHGSAGGTYSEIAQLHQALLLVLAGVGAMSGGCRRAQQRPTPLSNTALRFLGSAETARGSLPGPIGAGAHESPAEALSS